MLQGAGGEELLLEPPQEGGISGHLGFEDFDGHQVVGALAARLVDRAAAAATQLAQHLVGPQLPRLPFETRPAHPHPSWRPSCFVLRQAEERASKVGWRSRRVKTAWAAPGHAGCSKASDSVRDR